MPANEKRCYTMTSDFRQYITEYTVANLWCYPIRQSITFASALELYLTSSTSKHDEPSALDIDFALQWFCHDLTSSLQFMCFSEAVVALSVRPCTVIVLDILFEHAPWSSALDLDTVQLGWFFKITPPPPPPPRTGGVDFLARRGSSWYPTPIPTATDFSSTVFPPSSLRKTTHLPVAPRWAKVYHGELTMKD